MIFPYLYDDMSFKRFVILSLLSVSFLVAHASAINDSPAVTDTIRFDDGAWYAGEIADSLFNGNGKMVYSDSTVYEGGWKDGLWDGKGTIYYPDGDYYEGDFREHEFNGYGTYIYSDGAKYEGNWKNGMFNGAGTMNYADGSVYAGEWEDDMRNGYGVFYDSQLGVLYEGVFSRNNFVGSPSRNNTDIQKYNEPDIPSVDIWNPYFNAPSRPDSCWHYKGDSYINITYGINHILSLHADFSISKRYFAGFSLGFNTASHRIGEVSVTYDDETGEKNVLVDWDWYPDEIMTENSYNMLKMSGEFGVSWGWFSLGTAAGFSLRNTVRNCRSLEHNDSYYEPGTLYYREKVTGVKFAYDIFTDFIISRSIPNIISASMRTGYSNIDGFYIGAGLTF